MRDYPQGAFEALSWVKHLIENENTRCQGCQSILDQVTKVLNRIERGAAIDFSITMQSR